MSSIDEQHKSYKIKDEELDALLAKVEIVKQERSSIATEMLKEHGVGPHTANGEAFVIRNRGTTVFLSKPPGRKAVT